MFDAIAVVGMGLIGGSLALDIKRLKLANTLFGYDNNPAHCETAQRLGLVDQAFAQGGEELSKMELVILAAPVRALPVVLEQIHPWLRPQTIVSDVGSVKGPILKMVRQPPYSNIRFVGGHPISGSEHFGPQSARAGLFESKKFIATPTEQTCGEALEKIKGLWQAIGCEVYEMEADLHDRIFAEVSHLPHLLAYATIEAIGTRKIPNILSYFGAGLKDFSRIASSSPVMWADIFLENPHLLASIEHFRTILETLETAIREKDRESLMACLQHSKALRDQWIAQTTPIEDS